MYEVEFAINTETLGRLFTQARIDTEGVDLSLINTRVWNAVGAPPARPLGFNPSYDQGARGPTPRVTPFTVERLTCTFPAFVVKGDAPATRHYLNENITAFLDCCVKLAARRPDLIPQATMGITVRGLFEENEPSDENSASAAELYNFEDVYESVVVVYAGGDNSNYSVAFDVLKRPKRTTINHYDAT